MTELFNTNFNEAEVIDFSDKGDLILLDGEPPYYRSVYYEGGTDADRKARVISNGREGNALVYYMPSGGVLDQFGRAKHGRMQMGHPEHSAKHIRMFFSMYLGPAFEELKSWLNQSDLYALGEIYIGRHWKSEANVSIFKFTSVPVDGRLRPAIALNKRTANGFETVWSEIVNWDMPVNRWVEYAIDIVTGDKETGQASLWVKSGGGYRKLVQVNDWTYNPDSPVPVYMNGVQWPKLYARASLLQAMTDIGVPFWVAWNYARFYYV